MLIDIVSLDELLDQVTLDDEELIETSETEIWREMSYRKETTNWEIAYEPTEWELFEKEESYGIKEGMGRSI